VSIRITHLKRFLPGLDDLLEDASVTELMVNGPENVWVERAGAGLEPFPAPHLTAGVLHRAAIQIARPLGLDPESKPTLDARLDDGSRVAICVPPASPSVAITIRRFGKRGFTPEDLVKAGSLPDAVLDAARTTLAERRNILVAGGTGSGKTTMLNALISLLPPAERIVSIEDTLELRIHQPNTVRFEARELGKSATTVRDLVKHSLRHRPDHIVVGEIRGAEAADLLQALNTGHGGSLTTIHANNATSALDRLASCAMQARDLPWDAICRNIVNGISLVLHMSRIEGRRAVEEARYLTGWCRDDNTWLTTPAYLPAAPEAQPVPVP